MHNQNRRGEEADSLLVVLKRGRIAALLPIHVINLATYLWMLEFTLANFIGHILHVRPSIPAVGTLLHKRPLFLLSIPLMLETYYGAREVLAEGKRQGHARSRLHVQIWPDGFQGPRLIGL